MSPATGVLRGNIERVIRRGRDLYICTNGFYENEGFDSNSAVKR